MLLTALFFLIFPAYPFEHPRQAPSPNPAAQSPNFPSKEELLQHAGAAVKGKDFEEAEKTYRRILGYYPAAPEAYLGLGRCYLELGRYRDAAFALSKYVTRNPGDHAAARDFGRAMVGLNDFNTGESTLKKLVAEDPGDKESWYYLGVLMYQNGYYAAADQALEKSQSPGDDEARKAKIAVYRAVCGVHLGRAKDAEAQMAALAKNPDAQNDPDLLLVYGQLLYDTNRPEQALEQVNRAVDAHPESPMGYTWQGKVLYRLGRLPEAAAAEEKAVQLAPNFPYPRSVVMKIYEAQGRTADAALQAEWLRSYEARHNSTADPGGRP